MRSLLFCLLFAGLSATAQAGMEPLSGEEMDLVTGQNGIAFEWDLQVNTLAGTGTPAAICTSGADKTQCRLAMKFANREEAGGEWLVWKNFSGRLYFSRFNLDAYTSPAGATAYADASRFVDGLGSPVSPYGKPGLKVSFPESLKIYNLRIGGMAVEYGTGLAANTGFRADPLDTRSFIGLAINNSVSGQPATLAMDGYISVFGF